MFIAVHSSEENNYLSRQVNIASSHCTFPHNSFSKSIFGHKTNTKVATSALVLYCFFLFTKLKISGKVMHLESLKDIQNKVMTVLKDLQKTISRIFSRYDRDTAIHL
jgi:hypothetical protein